MLDFKISRLQKAAAGVQAGLSSKACPLKSASYSWAARYNTWLLIKLTPKGVVFSFSFFSASYTAVAAGTCSAGIPLVCCAHIYALHGICVHVQLPGSYMYEVNSLPMRLHVVSV